MVFGTVVSWGIIPVPSYRIAKHCINLPLHIQQVDMESNGKRVDLNGKLLKFAAGEIDFGEPRHQWSA